MEDEGNSHGNVTNVGSPESPCLKTSSNSNTSHNNKEQDRFLPIANVGRIMKKVLPGNGKISKDAKETVQECVSEFISFVTGEASDKCQREKRKTINGDDIIWAVTTLGFEDYVVPLKTYLNKYREMDGERLNVPGKQQQQQQQHRPSSSSSSDHIQHRLHQQQQQHQQQQPTQQQMVDQGQDNSSSSNNNMGFSSSHNNGFSINLSHQRQPSPFAVGSDHQPLMSLPFSPNSLRKQLQQHQDHVDSLGQW